MRLLSMGCCDPLERLGLIGMGLLVLLLIGGCDGGGQEAKRAHLGGGPSPDPVGDPIPDPIDDDKDLVAPSVPAGLRAEVSSSKVELSWRGSDDSGGSGLAGYRIYRDGVAVATPPVTTYADIALSPGTAYRYSVAAYDAAGNESAPSPVVMAIVWSGYPGDTIIRVNAGGGVYTDNAGHTWRADTGFNGGSTGSTASPIAATLDDKLFQSDRWDSEGLPELRYDFPVSNGDYTVNLYFAEIWKSAFRPGRRVFDVWIEGQWVLEQLDIFDEAGANTALIKSIPVTVIDGRLDVDFSHVIENPKISAIEVLPRTALAPPILTPRGGKFVDGVQVTLAAASEGGGIYYTLDGSDPNQESNIYTGPFTLSADTWVNARAIDESGTSTIASAYFDIVNLPIAYDFSDGNANDWQVFDDTPTPSSWLPFSGGYRQKSFLGRHYAGSYHLGSYAYLPALLGLTDYRASVDVTPLKDTDADGKYVAGNGVGMLFRYLDENNYYRISFSGSHGYARLEKRVNGVFTNLASDSRGYLEDQTFTVSVVVAGDLIAVYRDGESLFSVRDTSLASGSVGLYAEDAVQFDNVSIEALDGQPRVILSQPTAHSVSVDGDMRVAAVAMNVPADGSVDFSFDGLGCSTAVEEWPGYYTADCGIALSGEHQTGVSIRDASGIELAGDVNAGVGVGESYIAIGDSITLGVFDLFPGDNQSKDGRMVGKQGFGAHLNDLLTATTGRPNIVFNEGYGGDKISNALARLPGILDRHADARKVLILIGTNEVSEKQARASGLACTGSSCDGTYKQLLQTLVDRIAADGRVPIVARVPPVFGTGTAEFLDPLTTPHNQLVQEYNQVIATELTGAEIGPDFFSLFYGDGGTPGDTTDDDRRADLFHDFGHPNSLGYRLMAAWWHDALTGVQSNPFFLHHLCNRLVSAGCLGPIKTNQKQALLDVGIAYYTDASYTLKKIPETLQGGTWLITANGERENSADNYIEFEIDRPAAVYVAYDAAALSLPEWLAPGFAPFSDTGEYLETTNMATPKMRLYRRDYPPGVVTLAGNVAVGASGAGANYLVIVVPQ